MVLLGWSPPGEEELLRLDEIVEHFSLDRVAKNPAVFDLDKLNWINGCYLRQSELDRLTELAIPFLQKAGLFSEQLNAAEYAWVKLLVESVRDRISCLSELVGEARAYRQAEVQPENEEAQAVLLEEQVPLVAQRFREKLEALERAVAALESRQDGATAARD